MNYKVLALEDSEEWNDLLGQLPINQQDVYFTPEYYSLYQNYGDGEACCFVFEHGGEIILYPFLKNSINRLGYKLDKKYFDIQGAYGYNGIVSSCNSKEFLADFQQCFGQYCLENNIVAEFVRFHPLLENKELVSENTKVIFDRKTISVDLTLPENDIWNIEITSKNRNHICKAQKSGLEFYADYNFQYINEFVALYNSTMNRVHAESFYYFSDEYYEDLVYRLKGHSFLGVILRRREVIAAAIFMYEGIYGHYHLSGSNKEHLNLCPNNLLIYEAAKELRNRGVKLFHLGGGTTSETDDPLFKFKHAFGRTENVFAIGKRIFNQEIYENICDAWAIKFPEKVEKYKHFLLKYRY